MIGTIGTGLLMLAFAGAPPMAEKKTVRPHLARTRTDKKVMLNFDSTPLTKVVKWMSKNTGRNFIVEDTLKHRRITIVSGTSVTAEEAYQAFLSALDAERMYAQEEGKFIRISSNRGRAPVRARAGISMGDCPPPTGIRQVDETTWCITRPAYEEWLDSGSCMAVQARIVPAFRDGEPSGFKLFSIKPGSLYDHAGIKNGDVIQKVNGQAFHTPEQALEVYEKLRYAKTIELDILRRGQARKHTYRLE